MILGDRLVWNMVFSNTYVVIYKHMIYMYTSIFKLFLLKLKTLIYLIWLLVCQIKTNTNLYPSISYFMAYNTLFLSHLCASPSLSRCHKHRRCKPWQKKKNWCFARICRWNIPPQRSVLNYVHWSLALKRWITVKREVYWLWWVAVIAPKGLLSETLTAWFMD